MNREMLDTVMAYHAEGLCVIPIIPNDKRPAIDWIEYHERRSTEDEIIKWFTNGHNYNCGIVHGAVSDNYITLDIDHDAGIYDTLKREFPALFAGRIEQSGSWQGYHIPLKTEQLPDFGLGKNGPKGNKTWHTPQGDVNCRARYCQTVAPPSVHPTGKPYHFIQTGNITTVKNLNNLIVWLDELCPPKETAAPVVRNSSRPVTSDNLLDAVRQAWDNNPFRVFDHFGWANDIDIDRNDEMRLLGHGGLLISDSEPPLWYCFADEVGGDVFDAWGYCRFGTSYDKRTQFRQVLIEMAQAGGVDAALYYKRGDEQAKVNTTGNRSHWTQQRPVLSRMRA